MDIGFVLCFGLVKGHQILSYATSGSRSSLTSFKHLFLSVGGFNSFFFFLISNKIILIKKKHPSTQEVNKRKEIKYKNCKSLGNQ